MRNRAKCKLCKEAIESVANVDYVSCKCGEIAIDGGLGSFRCFANDFKNFMRLDDEGNEVMVKVLEKPNIEEKVSINEEKQPESSREKSIEMIDAMIKYYEELPVQALLGSPSNYDMKAMYLMMKQMMI